MQQAFSKYYYILKSYLKDNPAVIWIFFSAVVLRLISFLVHHKDFWYQTYLIDDSLFFTWAHEIASGNILGLQRGVFRMNPGYPYTLALIIRILGSYRFMPHLVQYFVGSVTAVLIYVLAKKLFNPKTAVVAGFIAAFYGMSVFYEGRLLGSVWILFFNTLMLIWLVEYGISKKSIQVFFAGACLGFSALYLPTVMFFIPFVFIGFLIVNKAGASSQSNIHSTSSTNNIHSLSVLFIAGILAVAAPFIIRNIAAEKKLSFTLTTSSGGVNFFLGNNPEANGYNARPSFIRYSPEAMHDDFKNEAQSRLGRQITDSQASAYWFGESLKWIRGNPKKAFRLIKNKSVYFWNAVEPPDNFMMDTVKKYTRVFGIPLISWGMLAPFAIFGFVLALRQKRGLLAVLYTTAYFLVNVLFYILSRYRFPASIGIIILSAFCLVWVYETFKAGKYKKVIAACVIIGGLFLFVHKKVVQGEIEWSKHYSVGVIYMNTGHIDKAIEEYKKSILHNPQFAPSRINLANLYLKKMEYELAAEQFAAAAQYDEDNKPEILRILGEIYFYHLEDFQKSVEILNNSIKLGHSASYTSLADIYHAAGMFNKALEVYKILYDTKKNDPGFLYKMGLSYYYNKKLDEAVKMFGEVLALDPEHSDAKNAIGYIKKQK